jgi:GTPase SAR1 family protein
VKRKSFEGVQEELETFLRYNGKVLAPGILEDTMEQIGVREVTSTSEADEQPTKEMPQKKKLQEASSARVEVPEIKAESINSQALDDSTLESVDLDGFEEALSAVDEISDKFLSPTSKKEDVKMGKVRVSLTGKSKIIASSKTRAAQARSVSEHGRDESIAEDKKAKPKKSSAHVIKPVLETKAIILGEEGVGKGSLLRNAEFGPELYDEDAEVVEPYAYSKMYELDNHRVKVNVWLFDKAADFNISRADYYCDASVIIIVYSVADRWSFDSIEFWLREASIHYESQPPIVIVGNKKDLREEEPMELDEMEDAPVSTEEGFALAEEIAKKLGEEDRLHPVAFIECSCLSGKGIDDVFRTAAELFENSL